MKVRFNYDDKGRVTSQSTVQSDFQPGPGYVFGPNIIPQECYVQNGEVHPVPEAPTPHHTWDWPTRAWLLTLKAAKAAKWDTVKAARDAREFGPFEWSGHSFDGDIQAQRRLNLAILAAQAALVAGAPWSIEWTLADNSVVALSAADMVGVVQALGANIDAAHEEARAKRLLIESATTVEELAAIAI